MNHLLNNVLDAVSGSKRDRVKDALRAKADQARDARDWTMARDLYADYLSTYPLDAAIWVQYGHALKEHGDFRSAENAYQRSLTLVPDVSDTYLQLGHVYKLMQKRPDAIDAYQRALQLDPSRTDAGRELRSLGEYVDPGFEEESENFRSDVQRTLIDLSDVFFYLRHHSTVSGIQRVQLGIAEAILGGAGPKDQEVAFITEALGGTGYIEISPLYMNHLIKELSKAKVSHASLKDIMEVAVSSGHSYRPKPKDLLLVLGAFWVISNAIERIVALKDFDVSVGILIHDIIPITHQEFCEASLTDTFHLFFANVLRICDFVLTVSDHSRKEVQTYVTKQGLPTIPIINLRSAQKTWDPPLSSAPVSRAVRELSETRYVLFVSTIEIRKNHTYLFRIWKNLIQEFGDDVPTLVFVGRPGWRVRDLMDQIESTNGLDGHLRILHGLSDAELATLYRNAMFSVFPSLEEGWGLPVGESLIFGCPCAASNTSSIPEVGGDFVDYFDPTNLAEGQILIRRLITDTKFRESRATRIRLEFKPRTWADVTRDMFTIADEVRGAKGFTARKIERPVLEPGKYYQLGHGGNMRSFLSSGTGVVAHFLFDPNWHPIETFGRWLRGRAGRIQIGNGKARAHRANILLTFESPGWISGTRVEIRINEKQVGTLNLLGGQRQQLALEFDMPAEGCELNFELVGDIAEGPDPRHDLAFGLTGIAIAEKGDVAAHLAFLEARLNLMEAPRIQSGQVIRLVAIEAAKHKGHNSSLMAASNLAD